jgi:hypothetical protein
VQYTLCVALPSGLPGGPIVLEGFCWNLVSISKPGSTYDSKVRS